MINPFTLPSRITQLQAEILQPLYTIHPDLDKGHPWLLVLTGRIIEKHRPFLEEIAQSRLVASVFKIVKLLGGANQLTEDDFERFTSYVNDGGLKAMVTMLLAANKEKTFLAELSNLPPLVQNNAARMLFKSAALHTDFIHGFFIEQHGSLKTTPQALLDNYLLSDRFIKRLACLADGD